MKKLWKKVLPIAALACIGSASFTVQAADINSLWIPNASNQMEDTDAERILRCGDNGCQTIESGDLMVGDIIESVLIWNTTNGFNIGSNLGFAFPYQFTAYSQLLVDSLTDVGGGFVSIGFAATGNLQTAGSLIDIYQTNDAGENIRLDTLSPDDADATVAKVQTQDYMTSLGFFTADDFWDSVAPLDIGTIVGSGPGSPGAGQATFGLSALANPGLIPYLPLGQLSDTSGLLHDFVGATSVYNPEATEASWTLASNSDITFFTQDVPTPGTLALFGLGLLGIAGAKRRKA
jgi:hypothetical protein